MTLCILRRGHRIANGGVIGGEVGDKLRVIDMGRTDSGTERFSHGATGSTHHELEKKSHYTSLPDIQKQDLLHTGLESQREGLLVGHGEADEAARWRMKMKTREEPSEQKKNSHGRLAAILLGQNEDQVGGNALHASSLGDWQDCPYQPEYQLAQWQAWVDQKECSKERTCQDYDTKKMRTV